MKKFLASILMSVLLIFVVMQFANAEEPKLLDEEPKIKRESPEVTPYEEGRLYWMQMPVVCGTTKTVKDYIDEHKFILVYVGVGKQGGKDTGEPVYLISEYVTQDMKQSLSVTTTLTLTESCIMLRGFDLQFRKSPLTKGTSILELQTWNLTLKNRQ